jgi:2-polyprenyl-6-methoxyphenol hydroxylase-like FAD-dependent oxidoreductase
LIVATGKHEFKALQERRGRDSAYVGFKTHLILREGARERLSGNCDLFVFPHGYGGLAMVEENRANFCFLIRRDALARVGSEWDALRGHIARANRHAASYLVGASPLGQTDQAASSRALVAIAGIPYGFVRRTPAMPNVYLVGDQFAVIPSLTGDGMAIALMTARLAVDAISAQENEFYLDDPQAVANYHLRARAALAPQVAMGYYAHRLFRHPRACDLAAAALRRFPSLARWFFLATRSPRLGEGLTDVSA